MTYPQDVKDINKWLSEQGRLQDGRPVFKLVWSTDELEKRKGTFTDYYGAVIIREVTEVRTVPKYNYLPDRWILETFSGAQNSELVESQNGTYEPIYVFEDKNRNFLKPTLKVVQFMVNWMFRNSGISESPGARLSRHKEIEAKEVQYFEDALDLSPTQSLLHSREAVGYTKELRDK